MEHMLNIKCLTPHGQHSFNAVAAICISTISIKKAVPCPEQVTEGKEMGVWGSQGKNSHSFQLCWFRASFHRGGELWDWAKGFFSGKGGSSRMDEMQSGGRNSHSQKATQDAEIQGTL